MHIVMHQSSTYDQCSKWKKISGGMVIWVGWTIEGSKAPSSRRECEAPRIEAGSAEGGGICGGGYPSPGNFLKTYMRIYAFRSILAVKK
jgi:hypothetical protein